jgi:superfamily II DNA or RNA helicase
MSERESHVLRTLMVHETSFTYPSSDGSPAIQEVFRALVHDETRTSLIVEDVRRAVAEGRRCLILSQWRDHCRLLAEGLSSHRIMPFVLDGALGKKQRTMLFQAIQATPPEEPLVIIATGSYLGEGFDCPQIDTLFLAFPISFKGKLVQYVGRVLRDAEGKTRVIVYDYADIHVPVLKHMHARRLKTYKTLGFAQEEPASQEAMEPRLFLTEGSTHEHAS